MAVRLCRETVGEVEEGYGQQGVSSGLGAHFIVAGIDLAQTCRLCCCLVGSIFLSSIFGACLLPLPCPGGLHPFPIPLSQAMSLIATGCGVLVWPAAAEINMSIFLARDLPQLETDCI